MVDISKRKFKKTARPSSAAVIDATATQDIDTHAHVEIEVVLVDTEVESEGAKCVGIVSLARVMLPSSMVVVSEAGFVTSLGTSFCLTATSVRRC